MNAIACYTSRQGASLAVVAMSKGGVAGKWSDAHLTDHGFYVVNAPAKEETKAHEGIARLADRHAMIDEDAVHCPQCRGIHVEFPARPEKSATAALTAKIAEVAGMKAPTFLCHECQYSWSPEDQH